MQLKIDRICDEGERVNMGTPEAAEAENQGTGTYLSDGGCKSIVIAQVF